MAFSSSSFSNGNNGYESADRSFFPQEGRAYSGESRPSSGRGAVETIADAITKHRSYGPSRIVDSMMDLPTSWLGALGAGLAAGAFRNDGAAISDWLTNKQWFKDLAGREGFGFMNDTAKWVKDFKPRSIFGYAKDAGKKAAKGAAEHFHAHSPFAWAASGVQAVGKGVGNTVAGVTGQVAGEAVRGLAGGALWLGTTLAAGIMHGLPSVGGTLAKFLGKGAEAGEKLLTNRKAIAGTLKRKATAFANRVAEPVALTESRNLIEAVSGYRMKKGVEATLGRAVAYGLPAAGLAYGALTAKGRIDMQPIQNGKSASVYGASYAPSTSGLRDLGATGDLTLALHALAKG